MVYTCQVCKKKLKAAGGKKVEESKYFPFCSDRCRLVDLGAWLEEDYRVEVEEDEDFDDFVEQ